MGKGQKCWLPAFSPFPAMFSKDIFLWVIKSWDCGVKGQCMSDHKICLGKGRNFLRTSKNADLQHFLLFSWCFSRWLKFEIMWWMTIQCFFFFSEILGTMILKTSFSRLSLLVLCGPKFYLQMLRRVDRHLKQEGHDGPVSLHWLIREIHSYQTLHYLGIGLKHKTPYKD